MMNNERRYGYFGLFNLVVEKPAKLEKAFSIMK